MNFRICTYNIHKGLSPFNFTPILSSLKNFLVSTKSDVVLLQEVVGRHHKHKNKHGTSFIEKQFEYLSDSVWPEYAYGQNAVYPNGDHGNAILSNFNFITHINTDISIGIRERRGLLHAKIKFPNGKILQCFNTHLNLRSRDRLKQINLINEKIADVCGIDDSVILAGDFNDWQNELTHSIKEKLGFVDARDIFRNMRFNTFPSSYPVFSLDRIYYRNLNLINCEVLRPQNRFFGSDHLPLIADFTLDS